MAYRTVRVKRIVSDFVKAVIGKLSVDQVILFGSYGSGRANRHSDIDLAVVSQRFAQYDDIKRIMLLSNIVRKIKLPDYVEIDAIGFSPKDLQNPSEFDIAGEVKRNGVVVWSKLRKD